MGLPQRRHRRKRVQNVAHGAQPNHQQAKVGVRLQALIFSQRRVGWKSGQSEPGQPGGAAAGVGSFVDGRSRSFSGRRVRTNREEFEILFQEMIEEVIELAEGKAGR